MPRSAEKLEAFHAMRGWRRSKALRGWRLRIAECGPDSGCGVRLRIDNCDCLSLQSDSGIVGRHAASWAWVDVPGVWQTPPPAAMLVAAGFTDRDSLPPSGLFPGVLKRAK